jgi:adenine phosphoribosyltransferase
VKIKQLENSQVIDSLAKAQALIKSVPDYPKPGIVFKDITPLIANAQAFTLCVDAMAKSLAGATHVAGLEARGFVFAAAIAARHNLGFVLLRKPGKLPREVHKVEYALEYGSDSLELHKDQLNASNKVVIVDDILATGGTLSAGISLVGLTGAEILGSVVLGEIPFLAGRKKVLREHPEHRIDAVFQF